MGSADQGTPRYFNVTLPDGHAGRALATRVPWHGDNANAGLLVMPKTGHVVNQEEPALFNDAVADFIARVEAGRWPADPARRAR